MIISRTPFRVSFFGGATDYPAWYREHGGAVLSTTIDKYCYISVRELPPLFDHKYRLVYSRTESVKTIAEIAHPSARTVLTWLNVEQGLEIHHDADLPARSGLGSSSAFTVGLIHAMRAMAGGSLSANELARHAIHVEQDLIPEPVGSQDQIATAYGGFNHITFGQDGSFRVDPLVLSADRVTDLQAHLMMVFTGISRNAPSIAETKIRNLVNRVNELQTMQAMVREAIATLLSQTADLDDFGRLLHESWLLKRGLSEAVATPLIDDIYAKARQAGAIGGKILGAGGGGFLLLFVRPAQRAKVSEALRAFVQVPVLFENSGSRIVLYQPDSKLL